MVSGWSGPFNATSGRRLVARRGKVRGGLAQTRATLSAASSQVASPEQPLQRRCRPIDQLWGVEANEVARRKLTASPSDQNTLASFAKSFCADTRGLILPYVTMMLIVIIGVSLLALDGARFMSLQTQLQNVADALALAGAAELDRLPDSETRAREAIGSLLTNSLLFGNSDDRNVGVSNISFYSQLPTDDSIPISSATVASGP